MTIENSGKIGIGTGDWTPIAGAPLNDVERAGFAWHYNWSASPLKDVDTTPEASSFIPMAWDETSVTTQNLALAKLSGAATLLGFNEPDNPDQARMTVEQALALWPQLEATGMRLGSPATTQYGMLGAGSWLGRFMAGAESEGLEVDFITTHYYSADKDVDKFERWLEAVHAQYNKPIWVTEWALADWVNPSRFSAAEQAEFARAGTEMMDDLPFVEKQAWFAAYDGGDGWDLNSGVFDETGALTPVGEAFSNMNRPAPGPTILASIMPPGLVLNVSEDAWLGDARFTVSIDGQQIGGVRIASASHQLGQTQAFAIDATLSAGTHQVGVTFVNDSWGGTASTDRNLFLTGATYNGQSVSGSTVSLFSNGTAAFSLMATATTLAPVPTPTDGLVVQLSEDAYQGDAQFTVSVDGTQLGAAQAVTARHGAGASQAFSFAGNFAPGAHQVSISFLNDLWNPSTGEDRNLYVQGITLNGATAPLLPVTMYKNGHTDVVVTAPVAATPTPVPIMLDTLVLRLSEDAYNGDTQFIASVDGHALGAAQSVTALNGAGASQAFTFSSSFGPGAHDLAVTFLNDFWNPATGADRNLYVQGATLNGAASASPGGFVSGDTHQPLHLLIGPASTA